MTINLTADNNIGFLQNRDKTGLHRFSIADSHKFGLEFCLQNLGTILGSIVASLATKLSLNLEGIGRLQLQNNVHPQNVNFPAKSDNIAFKIFLLPIQIPPVGMYLPVTTFSLTPLPVVKTTSPSEFTRSEKAEIEPDINAFTRSQPLVSRQKIE